MWCGDGLRRHWWCYRRDSTRSSSRHLRAFAAVAEELSFTRAAERLFISGPALSRQIRTLERAVGCPLLRRSTHHVELTLAGEALLSTAHDVMASLSSGLATTRVVGGELEARMAGLWEPVLSAADDDMELGGYRVLVEELHAEFPQTPSVDVMPVTAGGVPALRLAPSGRQVDGTLLYVHGGGYVAGSAFGYRSTVAALLDDTSLAAVVPDYRLAPEHPYPAGLTDVTAAYRWLLDAGTDPDTIVVAGDSAGAGLALTMLLHLKALRLPLPAGAAFMCPWLDLTCAAMDEEPDAEEPVMTRETLLRFAEQYTNGHAADELLSPLDADLSGLPPVLVQVATVDPLRHDGHALAERLTSAGGEVSLQVYDARAHAFQLFWSFYPEAARAVASAAEFLQAVVRGTAPAYEEA